MVKPTIGQQGWGETLNAHLDTLLPTATASATFEPISSVSLGRRRFRPRVVDARQLMTSPPAVGALTTSSGITSAVTVSSLVSPGTVGSAASTVFTYLGSAGPVQQAATFPGTHYVKVTHLTTINLTTPGYVVEFGFDGTTLEVMFKGNTGSYRLWVDGQLVTAGIGGAVPNDGAQYLLPVTFATRQPRTIRVEAMNTPFGGVKVGPNDTVWTAQKRGPRVIVLGDSYTEGTALTSATGASFLGWPSVMGALMGWPDVFPSGVGGTGYLNPSSGGKVKFRDRITNDVLAWAPDLVIVAGGHNDNTYGEAAVTAEATALFAALRAGLPATSKIWATGPFYQGSASATYTPVQSWIFAAPGADAYIDTVNSPIFTGTGRVGATTGSGNSDLYISTDAVHPTAAGQEFLGYRMAAAASALLGA